MTWCQLGTRASVAMSWIFAIDCEPRQVLASQAGMQKKKQQPKSGGWEHWSRPAKKSDASYHCCLCQLVPQHLQTCYIDRLQDCGISSALAMAVLQPCTKPTLWQLNKLKQLWKCNMCMWFGALLNDVSSVVIADALVSFGCHDKLLEESSMITCDIDMISGCQWMISIVHWQSEIMSISKVMMK